MTLPAPEPARELRDAPRAARSSILVATSASFERGSLALNRKFIYWREAGVTQAFALP